MRSPSTVGICPHFSPTLVSLRWFLGGLLAFHGLADLLAAQTAPYTTPPTNTVRSVTNFNVETVRGMASVPGETRLWVISSHNSTLMGFDLASLPQGSTLQPTLRYRTIQNPSAMQIWQGSAIVVGGGTHGVVKQSLATGRITDYLELPSEPMDIVIDTERDRAFVSCAGAYDEPGPAGSNPTSGGVVVEIDLATFTKAGANGGEHFIDGTRPMFLDLEMKPGTGDNLVFVTPFLSGNDTTYQERANGDSAVAGNVGLPDEDLFEINEAGLVTPRATGAGTLLTAHGVNPVTGHRWILGVDSLNAAQHTEADHRGRFAKNQIAVFNGAGGSKYTISLDGTSAAVAPLRLSAPTPHSPDKPASFPFGLAFSPAALGGYAFVTSSTGDTLRILDSSGSTLRNVELPEGSIPRGLFLSPASDFLFVQAWGLNKVFMYGTGTLFFGPTADPYAILDLGEDPLPKAVRHGREIWYDADVSNDTFASPAVPAKVSCNTCHPRGATDFLGWELSGAPVDRKDLMVTQSLLSIEDTFPYHWRGERSLSDFNGAFAGLLGGAELSSEELADFEAFVFSLQGAANPRQNLERRLDPSAHKVEGSLVVPGTPPFLATGTALNGDLTFHSDTNALLGFTPVRCVDCHGAETGSNGIITADVRSILPTEAHLDVAHLRQLGHKFFQRAVPTPLGMRPRGGFGFSQDGDDNDIMDFLDVFFFPPPTQTPPDFQINIQKRADTAAFVAQFDEGIAPRAHNAFLFDSTHATKPLLDVMVNAAEAGDIDLALVGHLGTTQIGVWYSTETDLFHTAEVDQPFGLTATSAALENLRSTGSAAFLVMGLPPGNGFRFAVDPDDDGASNTTEFIAQTNPFDADSDDDKLPDGYDLALGSQSDVVLPDFKLAETLFTNGRVSKHLVTFSEPVTYSVQVERLVNNQYVPHGPVQAHPALRTIDTLLVHHLLPSDPAAGIAPEQFRVQVTMTDLASNVNTVTLPVAPVNTRTHVHRQAPLVEGILVVTDLAVQPRATGTPVQVTLAFENLTSTPANLPQLHAVVQLVKQDARGDFTQIVTPLAVNTATRVEPTFSTFELVPSPTGPVERFVAQYGTAPGPVPPTDGLVEGPFVISPLQSIGAMTLDFTLSPSDVGKPIRVVLLGTFAPLSSPPNSAPRFLSDSLIFWQTAMTAPEKRQVDFVF